MNRKQFASLKPGDVLNSNCTGKNYVVKAAMNSYGNVQLLGGQAANVPRALTLVSRADGQPVMDDADATRTEMQAKARKLVKRWLIEAMSGSCATSDTHGAWAAHLGAIEQIKARG